MQGSKAIPVKGKVKRPRVSNRVTLDANNPIPFAQGSGTFSFVNQSSYLPFLPPKNNFAKDLLEARLLSPTNNTCIITKKDYCAGEGFIDLNGQDLPKEFLSWIKSMNLKNQSAVKINRNALEDFFTYGNVPIELVRFTVAGEKKLFIYVHSFMEWRLGKPDENDICQHAVQSKLFLNGAYLSAEDIKNSKQLPIYNVNKTEKENWKKDKDDKSVERTLIWYKNSMTGVPHYGFPSNIASLLQQLLEYKGDRYNLDNLDNNLVAAAVLALKGNLGQEEANRIGKKIIDSYTGDGKRGRTIVVASEEGIEGSELHKMDVKTDGSFKESSDKWSQTIIMCNQWDAVLMGVLSSATLGKGSGFITKIIEHKLKTVIIPAQQDLMDEVWSIIFPIADKWFGFGLDKYDIVIKNAIDISGVTDVDITPAVQVNEVRTAKGLPEDPNMKGVYMKSPAKKEGGENVPD